MAAGDVVQAKSAQGTGSFAAVTLDAAPTDGNILVVHVGCGSNTEYLFTGEGFTELTPISGGSGGNTRQSTLHWKIASSEDATITSDDGPNSGWAMSVIEIEGPIDATPLVVENAANTASGTTHASPAVTPGSGKRVVAVGAAYVRSAGNSWSGQTIGGSAATERTDEDHASANANSTIFTLLIESTGAGTYAASATSSNTAVGGGNIAIFEVAAAGGTPQNVSITAATETDTAQALTHKKVKSLTPAAETDTAQALSVTKTIFKTLTPASESDTAQVVSAEKHVAITTATETDTAQVLSVSSSGPQTISITPATETDTAQALSAEKHAALVAAAETDTAQALSVTKTIFKTLTPATESDAAQALAITKSVTLTSATETDTAQALSVATGGGAQSFTLTPATESDAAQALTITKRASLTSATEADTAQALSVNTRVSLTPAVETDTAQALSITKTIFVTITAALETDTAMVLSIHAPIHVSLTPATEVDEAQALTITHIDARLERRLQMEWRRARRVDVRRSFRF